MDKIKIGTQYKDRKTGALMTVTERYTVTNSKGEVVRVYFSARGYIGQIPLTNGDVPAVTILKNIVEG